MVKDAAIHPGMSDGQYRRVSPECQRSFDLVPWGWEHIANTGLHLALRLTS